jgi:hypothetical protein
LAFETRQAGMKKAASATATMKANAPKTIESFCRRKVRHHRRQHAAQAKASGQPGHRPHHRQADALLQHGPQHD